MSGYQIKEIQSFIREEARDMGLPVRDQMPTEIYELMDYYPQAKQQRPGVEFIPIPYRTPATPGKGDKA